MSKEVTVFVGNLPADTEWTTLKDLFEEYGSVHANVPKHENGKIKGFGAVKFPDIQQAHKASDEMDGYEFNGQKLTAHVDRKLTQYQRPSTQDRPGDAKLASRPGDWTCPSCNANVFASKSACFKCFTAKPGGK
jgi:RNA recognition motif-containing protein